MKTACHVESVSCVEKYLLAMFGSAPPRTSNSCTTSEWPSREAYINDEWPHLSLTLVSACSAIQRIIERTSCEFNSDLKHRSSTQRPSASFSAVDFDMTKYHETRPVQKKNSDSNLAPPKFHVEFTRHRRSSHATNGKAKPAGMVTQSEKQNEQLLHACVRPFKGCLHYKCSRRLS